MPIFEFLGLMLGVFAVCLLAAYVLGRAAEGLTRSLTPIEGGVVRIKCSHGVYRSRFLGLASNGWRLAAPLSRDSYVPFRPGEAVVLEAPLDGSAILARSLVLERDLATHELVVARPTRSHRVERRATRRVDDRGLVCQLEGVAAALVDVSSCGARLESKSAVSVGERVRLDLPWIDEPAFAWVIEVSPAEDSAGTRTVCRVRFEDAITLPRR